MKRFVIIIIIIISVLTATAQNSTNIRLKQERMAYAPKAYFIDGVIDDRQEAAWIGQINGGGRKEKLSIEGGVAASLNSFISANVSQDKAAQPIGLHVSKLDMDVKKQGELWKVDAAIMLTFYVGDKKVVEYSAKGHGEMDTDPGVYIESYIRQVLENDLKKFDEWWSQNKGRIATTSTVKVNVNLGNTTDKPNSIIYSVQRLLEISDFTGRPEGEGMELAITTSGISVGYSAQTENSQVVVDVTVTPYFSKPQSWFKPQGKNPRVLAHEQAHFDITAIKACELIATIRKTAFTQENYKQLLAELQEKNSQDANAEEVLYDNETNHGTIRDKQEAWENKVKEQVKTSGCY